MMMPEVFDIPWKISLTVISSMIEGTQEESKEWKGRVLQLSAKIRELFGGLYTRGGPSDASCEGDG